ncbi:STAS domain-containing protein [Floridanema evergladense]|uniref:Anti-sigma factor antagonist n=1 Tax=Floridaenema evergladense BLCC-F167 TaxID=3153639 RepID=A0ABV4WX78_9CYAN
MNSDPHFKILQPIGILDGEQGTKFRDEVTDLIKKGTKVVLIDFQDVTFMDSSGLGSLVIALKTVRASKAKIFICAINDQVRMLFDLTSMNKVFKIFSDRNEFIKNYDSIISSDSD